MLPKAIAVATLCASVALAHSPVHARRGAHNHHFQARQASDSTSAPGTSTPRPSPPASTPTVSRSSSQSRPPASQSTPAQTRGSTSATTTTTSVPTPTFDAPVVPISTAPGAIPLASILPNPATGPVPSPITTYPAGTKPKGIPNAPPLPGLGSWNGNAYPTPDKVPPTDSDEVLTWIQQVRDSGVVIPDFAPYVNNPNGLCNDPSNQPRIGNETACWWSCGHCTRKTDIIQCRKSKVWGSSFDDGPTLEDGTLLHYLEAQQLDTTFFVVGSRVAGRPQILQTEYLAGHQIGVHTWSHTPLTTQTSEQVIAELGWTKKVIKDAIGVTPYYMRPPYGDIDDRVRAIARAMNLTVVMWTTTGSPGADVAFDTFDHQVPGGVVHAEESVNQFARLLQVAESYGTGFIVLEHDLWWQEVALAVGYFLPTALGYGYDVTSIGNCMQQNIADTYVETSSTKQIPPGSGIGGEITGTGQVAPSNAPLGGSDGTNTDINVPSTDNPIDTDGGDSALSRDLGAWTMVAGFVFAGALTFASGL